MLLRSRLELPVIFFSTLDEDWTSREQASPSLILRSSARFCFSLVLHGVCHDGGVDPV